MSCPWNDGSLGSVDRRGRIGRSIGYGAEYVGLVADLGALSPESVDFQITDPRARARIHATSLRAIEERSGALAERIRSTYGRSATTAAEPGTWPRNWTPSRGELRS